MSELSARKYPTIGCCGIDCGLCPRYYTDGSSRCPGCGGGDSEEGSPSCGVTSCCVKKHGFEVCAECNDFPCRKYETESTKRDSFVTHRRMIHNQKIISKAGLDDFIGQQKQRVAFLETALSKYNNGRNKSFFCLASALLSFEALDEALCRADRGENLREVLTQLAIAENEELRLLK